MFGPVDASVQVLVWSLTLGPSCCKHGTYQDVVAVELQSRILQESIF